MTWVILGAGSALGVAFARAVAEQGDAVILAGRDADVLNANAADLRVRTQASVTTMAFDALNFSFHTDFAAECASACPRNIGVFLCFGLMPQQIAMQADFDLAHACVDTNFTAALSILEAFAAIFESGRQGKIVVVSSVAGDRGRAKNYIYGASKAALTAYCEGLRGRLFPLDVPVVVVKPGFLDTAMTWGLPGIKGAASVQSCARACLKAAENHGDTLYFPWPWRWIMVILKAIPARWFKRLKI